VEREESRESGESEESGENAKQMENLILIANPRGAKNRRRQESNKTRKNTTNLDSHHPQAA
jgi:hypothetical protein